MISSALIRARGAPERSSSVSKPLGVVLSLLAMLSGGMSRSEAVVELEVLAAERDRESNEPREPRGEVTLGFEDVVFLLDAESGSARVTI